MTHGIAATNPYMDTTSTPINKTSYVYHMNNICSTYEHHMENESENEKENKNDNEERKVI